MEIPPQPLLLPGTTTVMGMDVGSGRYSVVVTHDLEMAASWVRRLPLLELSPPVNRIIGISFVSSESMADSGVRFPDSISFSFFSRVLVLQLAPPTVDGAVSFPEDLRRFLVNPRNLFAGFGVGEASRVMGLRYGVRPLRTMELANSTRLLGWWRRPITGEWPRLSVETSVHSQVIGYSMLWNPPSPRY